MLIPNAFFDSASTTAIVSSNLLRNANWGPGQFSSGRGTVIFRPTAATSADYIRYASDLINTSGSLSHNGANYADTTTTAEIPELWYNGIRPDLEILDAINRALEFSMVQSFDTLSHGSNQDFGMVSSGVTSWTGTNATPTKSTTAEFAPYGVQSLRVANSGVNGYAQSVGLRVSNSQVVQCFGMVSAVTATPSMILYDSTNSANIATITTTQVMPHLIQIPWTIVPATCGTITLRLGGASATCDGRWNAVWAYKQGEALLPLPSYISEGFKSISVFQAKPRMLSTSAYTYYGTSLEMVELQEGIDYTFIAHHADANPYAINITPRAIKWAYNWPLFIETQRPASDLTTFTVDSAAETTAAPLHEIVPRIKLDLIDHLFLPRFPDEKKWPALRAIAKKELDDAVVARPIMTIAKTQPYFMGVGGGRI